MRSPLLPSTKRDGEGPLCIFLHGLQGDRRLFDTLTNEKFFQNKPVFAPDLPGFGESRDIPISGYTVSAYADVVAQAAEEQFGARDVIVIGHSLGGMIGIKLVSSSRLNVRVLISLEGNLKRVDCGASLDIAKTTESDFCTSMLPSMMSELSLLQVPSARFRLEALAKARPQAVYGAACSIVEESNREDLFRDFETASCHKLLMIGEKSRFMTRQLDKSVRIEIVPGASHFMLHDNYTYSAEAICRFIVTD